MRRAVIDTNVYSDVMRGQPPVQRALSGFERVLVPITVFGEILHGFVRGSKEAQNRLQLERFLSRDYVELVTASRATAEYYALLMTALRKKGAPLPINDVWIAAAACAEKIPLISRDQHFLNVPGLQLIVPQ